MVQRLRGIGKYVRNNWAFVLIGFFCLYMLLFVCIKGESLYFNANDGLDSTIPYYKVHRDALLSGQLGEDFVSPILGGDSMTVRLFNVAITMITFLYTVFPPFAAYIALYFVRILLGVSGFLLMARLLYDKEECLRLRNPAAIIGFMYGILPFWPLAGGIMLYPLLLATLVFAYKKNKLWTGLLVIPFIFLGVSFALFGAFVFAYLFLFTLIDLLRKKRLNLGLLSCVICLIVPSLLLSMSMIVNVTSGSTIRSGFTAVILSDFDLFEFLKSIFKILKTGQYHCGTNQQFFAAPLCLIWFILYNAALIIRKNSFRTIIEKPFNCCFLWFVLNGILYGVYYDPTLQNLVFSLFPFLRGFVFARFLWLNPLALYLCIFYIVKTLVDLTYTEAFARFKGKLAKPIQTAVRVLPALLMLCVFSSVLNPTITNAVLYSDIARNIDYALHPEKNKRYVTWGQLYSEDLFDEIKSSIGYNDEWSVAYGFLPSVLTYNDIRTLDGYDSGYSAEYREQFAKLIRPYLEAGTQYVDYFNNYGIRAYLFSDDIGFMPEHLTTKESAPLYMDGDVFREMGGVYVCSVVEITNSDELGLTLLGTWTHPESLYHMSVYKAE